MNSTTTTTTKPKRLRVRRLTAKGRHILMVLWERADAQGVVRITQDEIGEIVDSTYDTVSRTVQFLAASGALEILRDENDKRKVYYRLSGTMPSNASAK